MTDADSPSPHSDAATTALLASTDWAGTPLGPIDTWPKSLRGYAEMVLAMPTPAILFWGPEQTQIYNDGYALILGPRHPRAFGQSYREAWPETYPLIYPWMRHVLDEGGTWRVDRTHIPVTRHGFDEEAYFTFTFSALRDDDGRVGGILQPVFDVSESVLADRRAETLRRLQPEPTHGESVDEALQAMAHNPSDLPFVRVWLWDSQGMDLAPARGCGEPLADGELDRLDAIARSVWAEATPRFIELAAADAAGLARGALLLPLAGTPGTTPVGVIALGVSRRVHFNEAYRGFLELVARQVAAGLQRADAAQASDRQRRYLAELFSQLPAGIAVLEGPEHIFELANPSYLGFVGGREILGKRFIDALPEMRGQAFPDVLDEVYRTGRPWVGDEVPVAVRRGRDGQLEQTLFNIVYEPLRDERGLTSGILNFAYEVTEQVQARRSMERLTDELRAEHRRKDDFLAMLAHELRNPLAPIAAAAEVLRLQANDPRLRRTSEIVTRQVRHMAKLIDDLLDASRVTRGIVSVQRRVEDLRDVVADAVEQVTPHVEARRHRLDVDLPDAPVRVVGDRKRLVQALTNLLDNAVKYTPEGGVVAVTLERGAGQASLTVRDNGVGVSPELRERIFDLFVQGQRGADRAQGGLGIGLALARRLVDLHGGELSLESAGAGQGSEFTIRLPPSEPGPAPEAGADERSPADGAPAPLAIFVVDDNEDAAHMLAMLLEDAGHAVMTESDPVVALERAQSTRPDVFVLDIGLPRIDGHELARRLRASPAGADATLIALTGYGQPADREKAAQAGFDHYMVKPVDPAALERLLLGVPRRGG